MFNEGTAMLPSVTVNGTNYAGGTFTSPEALAGYLDQLNNLGCPLNNSGEKEDKEDKEKKQTSMRSQPGIGLTDAAASQFAVSGYPNPSRTGFNVQINGLTTEKVRIRVTDMSGRLVEQRTNLAANQVVSVGSNYRAGMYYIEVTQGENKQQIKMVKQ